MLRILGRLIKGECAPGGIERTITYEEQISALNSAALGRMIEQRAGARRHHIVGFRRILKCQFRPSSLHLRILTMYERVFHVRSKCAIQDHDLIRVISPNVPAAFVAARTRSTARPHAPIF